MASSRGKY